MGVRSPAETMLPLILLHIRCRCRRTPQQANPQYIPQAREPVLALGENRHPVPKLAEIGELVGADFEFGHVPSIVLLRRALEAARVGLVGGVVAVDVQGEFDCRYGLAAREGRIKG